jgi:long-chain acyl-CoA synthetase
VLSKMPQAKLDRLLRIPIVAGIVRKKIRAALGLAKTHSVFSGAASISPSLLDWYARLGIVIHEVYGMTETFGQGTTTASMTPRRAGSVGKPYDGVDLKLGPDGEVLLRCPSLMDGYYREPAKTAEVLTADGYYRTGDLGEIGSDGALRIIGRVREQFKTAKGEFVSPAPIEGQLMDNAWLEQVCVLGRGLAQPVALGVLSDIGKAQPREAVQQSFTSLLGSINAKLPTHERVAKLVLMNDPWTIENGLLTPTLKLKRQPMEQRYAALLERVIDRPGVVVWQ